MPVTVSGSGLDDLMEGVRFIKSHRLLIGIPESSGAARGGMTNVALAYLHSQGSPRMHIPARPFLEPAIEQHKDRLGSMMAQAAMTALSGDTGGALSQMHMAGFVGENAAKMYIGSGALAPNAPITVSGGWMRNPVSHKPVHVDGKGSSAPLIDTGNLRQSITHVVEGE